VNKGRLGGAGLHNGALSSKTMWEMSNDYTKALSSKRGFLKAQVSLSYTTMLGEVERAISSKEAQLQGSLEQLHIPLVRFALLEFAVLFARTHSPWTVQWIWQVYFTQ
jgi:dihydrolipoamide dehydrogenase